MAGWEDKRACPQKTQSSATPRGDRVPWPCPCPYHHHQTWWVLAPPLVPQGAALKRVLGVGPLQAGPHGTRTGQDVDSTRMSTVLGLAGGRRALLQAELAGVWPGLAGGRECCSLPSVT